MDYSKMSPIEIARNIVGLAEHTDVDSQPVPRCPWGAAAALGALPVARALVELDSNLSARRAEYTQERDAALGRVGELEAFIRQIQVARTCVGCDDLSCGAANEVCIGDVIDNCMDVDGWPESKEGGA